MRSDRKPTATQETENEVIKAAIVAGMVENRSYTVTEIIKAIPAGNELANQKSFRPVPSVGCGKTTRRPP